MKKWIILGVAVLAISVMALGTIVALNCTTLDLATGATKDNAAAAVTPATAIITARPDVDIGAPMVATPFDKCDSCIVALDLNGKYIEQDGTTASPPATPGQRNDSHGTPGYTVPKVVKHDVLGQHGFLGHALAAAG